MLVIVIIIIFIPQVVKIPGLKTKGKKTITITIIF